MSGRGGAYIGLSRGKHTEPTRYRRGHRANYKCDRSVRPQKEIKQKHEHEREHAKHAVFAAHEYHCAFVDSIAYLLNLVLARWIPG